MSNKEMIIFQVSEEMKEKFDKKVENSILSKSQVMRYLLQKYLDDEIKII